MGHKIVPIDLFLSLSVICDLRLSLVRGSLALERWPLVSRFCYQLNSKHYSRERFFGCSDGISVSVVDPDDSAGPSSGDFALSFYVIRTVFSLIRNPRLDLLIERDEELSFGGSGF